MFAMSSSYFVFCWVGTTVGGGQVVAGENWKANYCSEKFPCNSIINTLILISNFKEVLNCSFCVWTFSDEAF